MDINNNDTVDGGRGACRNCDTPLLGEHCWQCGQPVKGLIRPLPSWVADFLDTVFEYDGRLWRTLGPLLLRPGHLSREYIAGRRVRYVSPVRLFLFLAVLLFIAVRLFVDIDPGPAGAQSARPSGEDVANIERVIEWLPEAERSAVRADALSPPISQTERAGFQIQGSDQGQLGGTDEFRLSWLSDGLNAQLRAALAQMARNAQRINESPGAFVDQVLSLAPQTLFFILPLFALLLKLFYLFSGRMYLQHLLVAMHSHSFIAVNLLLILALNGLASLSAGISWLTSVLGWLQVLLALWIPVNLYLTQKRVYEQGWLLTSVKFVLLGLLYLLLLSFGSAVMLMLSLLLW